MGLTRGRLTNVLLTAILLAGCSGRNVALTDRQAEMVQLSDQYLAAWTSLDPAAVSAFFAPSGTIESILYDDEFRAGDGTLTERVQDAMNAFDMAALERVGPVFVDGDLIYSVARAGPQTFSTLLVFTPSGTVQLLRHISLNS